MRADLKIQGCVVILLKLRYFDLPPAHRHACRRTDAEHAARAHTHTHTHTHARTHARKFRPDSTHARLIGRMRYGPSSQASPRSERVTNATAMVKRKKRRRQEGRETGRGETEPRTTNRP